MRISSTTNTTGQRLTSETTELKRFLVLIALVGAIAAAESVWAGEETDDEIKALRQQIEALDQKVRILERKQELETEAAETKAKDAPKIIVGEKGFSIMSADGDFALGLKGLLQLDSRSFFQTVPSGGDGFFLRRARPILEGRLFRDIDFLFVPEFGGGSPSILDAYLNYRYKPGLQLQAGKFKSPVGLEQLQSDSLMPFIERALPTDLTPNRDLGVELHGDLFGGTVSYAAGIFNGVADSANSANANFDNEYEFAGRLFFQPFVKSGPKALHGLGFGFGGSYGDERGTSGVPGYASDGQQKFFTYSPGIIADGTHWRISPQGYYYFGPFGLLGEYVISSQEFQRTNSPTARAEMRNAAWQVVVSWVLTGEDVTYKGVNPAHPFNPAKGHWGAWELSARYASLEVDSDAFPTFANPATSARSADAWGVDLSWWLNRNLRASTAFSRTTFTSGKSGAAAREPENVLFTRVQLSF